ncbi:MAG: hypothetical protein R3E66_09500 [bacterium]
MSFEELREQYRAQDRWIDLAVLLERQRHTVGPPQRDDLTQELTSLLEYMTGVGDPEAVGFAESRLENLYLEVGGKTAFEALAGLYLDQSERQVNNIQRYLALRRKCARVFEERLNRADSALVVLLSSLGSDVLEQADFQAELERLGQKTGEWDTIFSACEEVLEQMHEDTRRAPIWVVLGRWSYELAGDRKRAVRWLEQALEVRPNDLTAISLMEDYCRRAGKFAALVEMLRFRIDAVVSAKDKRRGWSEIVEIAEGPLDDPGLAMEALEHLVELDPADDTAFERLRKAYHTAQRWDDLQAILRVRLASTSDSARRQQLQQSLAQAAASAGAIDDAIHGFRQSSVDAKTYVQVLKREADNATDSARARFLAEIGRVYAEEIRDKLASQHYYEQALGTDSQLIDAAEPMADVYLAEKDWERAAPLLENLLRRNRIGRDPAWLHRRFVQYAQCCDRMGKKGAALAAFREAYELRPQDTSTVKGFGKLLFDSGEWEKAVAVFGVLLTEHAASLQPAEVAGVNFMAAKCFAELGDEGRAIAAYRKVVDFNERHHDALRALVEIFDRREDWANFVQYADLLVTVEPEPLVRFRQLSKVGEVWASRLNRPDLAMVAYRAALDIDPASIVILRKLLDLYTRTEKYPLAVKVLERLIAGEEQPRRRATLHYTAGVICRDHVGNLNAAVDHFEHALDDDLDMLKAFEAIDRILTQGREWKELERSYRRMLKRVTPADSDNLRRLELLLWEGLAEIYRSRLGEFELAVDTYRVLQSLKPNEEKYRHILAELYEKMGDAHGALAEHRRLIQEDPTRVDSYHVLHDAYLHLGRYDAAWCVAGALSFLRCSTAHEESYYQKYLGRNLRVGRGQLNHEMYARIMHPQQDPALGALLSYAAEGLRGSYGVPLKSHGIDPRRDRVGPESPFVFRQIWSYVAGCLALPSPPELYQMPAEGLLNLNAEAPSVGVGPQRRDSHNDRESAFFAAKLLYAMRPDHYLATVFPPEANQTMLMAVIESVDANAGYSKQLRDPNFDRAVKELRKLPEGLKAPLRQLVARYRQRGAPMDLVAWTNGVEMSSTRAGLLLCGDLTVASSCVKYGTMQIGALSTEERMRDLLLFAVSENYFELRAHLELSIGGANPF